MDCFNSKLVPKETLLMSFKLSIGKVAILDCDAVHNEAIISISNVSKTTRDFLFYVLPLLVSYMETTDAIKGATLSKKKLRLMPVPVPPVEEQRRIVDQLNKLLPLVNELH